MVTLHSVRRVLEIDLRMDREAVESCLAQLAPRLATGSGAPVVPLVEVLGLLARAEAGLPAA